MPKFMSCHTLPAGALKREQVDQMAKRVEQMSGNGPSRSDRFEGTVSPGGFAP
jgi:hypothetical protein